jgi:hypothetical protein
MRPCGATDRMDPTLEKETRMGKPLRPLMAAITATLLALATSPSSALAEKEKTDCTDHCAEKAAQYCEDLEGWRCNVYIWGCLAGCNINKIG